MNRSVLSLVFLKTRALDADFSSAASLVSSGAEGEFHWSYSCLLMKTSNVSELIFSQQPRQTTSPPVKHSMKLHEILIKKFFLKNVKDN